VATLGGLNTRVHVPPLMHACPPGAHTTRRRACPAAAVIARTRGHGKRASGGLVLGSKGTEGVRRGR